MAGPSVTSKFARATGTTTTTIHYRTSSTATFRTSNQQHQPTNKKATPDVAVAKQCAWHQSPPPVRFVTTPFTAPITTPEDASWSSCSSTQDDSLSAAESPPHCRTLFSTRSTSSPQLRSRKSIECAEESDEDEEETDDDDDVHHRHSHLHHPHHHHHHNDAPWFARGNTSFSSKDNKSLYNYVTNNNNRSTMSLTALVPWLLALVSLTSMSMIFIMNHNVGSTVQPPPDLFLLRHNAAATTSPHEAAAISPRPPATHLHQLALKPSLGSSDAVTATTASYSKRHTSSFKHSEKHRHKMGTVKKPKARPTTIATTTKRRHHQVQMPKGTILASPWPLDPSMYRRETSTTEESEPHNFPRVVQLHHSTTTETESSPPPHRSIDPDVSPYTDETQRYDRTDSRDTPTMERSPAQSRGSSTNPAKSVCQSMADWQTTVYPSCNGMHEIQMEQLTLFGMKGFWRNAWRYDQHDETVVLKTLRYVFFRYCLCGYCRLELCVFLTYTAVSTTGSRRRIMKTIASTRSCWNV
jgi:hypothetical protein